MADNFTERENYILSNSVNIGWFLEAIDKNNPLHPEEGAAHTESYELDGQNILVPRVRIKDGKAILNKENALEEALERGDYIVVPEGEDPDQYSKDLSKLIGKFRGFNEGGSVESSLRPRARPVKNQTEEMLRPKSREDAKREQQLHLKQFGNLEYRADLDKQLSWNPIARLGYNPDTHKVLKQRAPGTGLAFQGGGPRTIENLKNLGYEDAGKAQRGSVVTTVNYSFSPVISHEFTHAGFDRLRKKRDEDPEAFDKKYGEDAGKILTLTNSGRLEEEYYVELFDDLDTRFNTDILPEDFKQFPKSTIRSTIQSSYLGPAISIEERNEEERKKRIEEIRRFQNIDLRRKEKEKRPLFLDGIDKGILGLMDAAQDILTEQGEPPKAKRNTLSFWEKVGKSFSNLRPVGARGLYEGGLSAQTEESFNIDAEGRRRRRPSQAYLERSKEGTGQVVENVLGALPGIGTAMTVEEIQEELQKDDPNYGKIALLGGSELIGLIPGLGTAAKAGLRKVADQVGANKLAKILDSSPPVKPEREMFMGAKSKKAPGEQNILEAFERDEQDIRDRLGQTMKEEISQGKSPLILDPRNTLEDAEFAVRETNLNKHLYPRTREAFEQEGYFLGRDKKLRFEISDKQANVQPYNIASFTEDEINNLPFTDSFAPQTWTQLDDVMDHPVLFENYPDLRDLPVIVDKDLAGKSTMGYFSHSDGGYIAISPDILKDSEQFRSTLLHEIMHSIQKKEGFESGTTPSSLKVSKALDYERNLPEAKAAWKKYNADYANYKKAVDESLLELPDKMLSFIAEKIEKDTAGAISFQDIMNELSKGDQANFFGTFFSKAFEKKADEVMPDMADLLFSLDSLNTLYYYKGGTKATRVGQKQKLDSDLDSYVGTISSIYRRLVPFVKSAEDVDLFQKTMGFAPEKANDTGIAKLMRPDLEEPKTPSYVNPDSDGYLALLDRHKIYKRKMGEVEARNVQARSDLTQEEIDALRIRGKGFEESEDTPPEMQWKDSDFNKGGTVMNKQMEMAFMKEGGLKDDGMKVDPVSGNEIPPGSMAKEVRDDIPAQLSEGEYVVPADVVQYYGVKHFEDLRNKAKDGLKQMEKDGRIGGEPVYANTGAMVQGGFSGPSVAPAQPGVAQTPMTPQNPAPFNPMQTPMQGNPGAGFVYQTPEQQAYDQPTRYYGSFSNAPHSITQPPNTPVPVVGQPVTPPVDTPESCEARGMVFNPETGMCVLPDPTETPQTKGGGDDDGPTAQQADPDAWMDKYSYDDVDKLLSESSASLDPATGLAGFLGKALGGGALGMFAKGSNAAQVAANINILSSIPESSLTAAQKESLAGLTTKYKDYVKSNNLDIFGTELINGDQLAIDIITNPKNRGKGLFLTADSVDPFGNRIFKDGEKDPKFIKVMEDVASPGYKYDPKTESYKPERDKDDDGGSFLAPETSIRPRSRPTNVTSTPAPKNNNNNRNDGPSLTTPKANYGPPSVSSSSSAKEKVAKAVKEREKEVESDDIYSQINKGGLMVKKRK